jgi:hypothetical protein
MTAVQCGTMILNGETFDAVIEFCPECGFEEEVPAVGGRVIA